MGREEDHHVHCPMPTGIASRLTMMRPSLASHSPPGLPMHGPGYYGMLGLTKSGRGRSSGEILSHRGKMRTEASLLGPVHPRAFVRFHLPWRWNGRAGTVESRTGWRLRRGHEEP